MGFKNSSDYGNIENRRSEKVEILKWKKRLIFSMAFVFSFFIVQFSFGNSKEMFAISIFFTDWANINNTKTFNLPMYLYVSGVILFVFYLVFGVESKKGLIRKIEVIGKRNKKPSLYLKTKLMIISFIDKGILYLLFPLSYVMINLDSHNKKNIEKFYIRVGWLEHLEYSFFKEVAIKVDGYERAKELKVLSNYKELFSEKRGDAIYGCHIYQTIYKIFLSEKEMNDLMYITEGYLSHKDEPKYDVMLDKAEYKQILKKKYNGVVDNFRCYDGVETIYYSHDLIKDFLDQEANRFKEYMKKYATTSRQTFTRNFLKNFRLIKDDKQLLNKIANYNLPNIVKVEQLQDDKVLTGRIIEFCSALFRIVGFKLIVGQYMNLPAGTMVVKIEDYTTRMAIEVFDEKVLIQIVKGKNDGQSKDFSSDTLVNIFLAAYNYFNISSEVSFERKAEKIFNFTSDAINQLEKETEEKDINEGFEDFSEGYRAITTDEMNYIRANIK